jgi:N-acetylmuramoyl-L-alanine amidase
MKPAICLVLLWAIVTAAAAQSPLSKLPRVSVHGKECVRLEDWARANRFQVKWTTPRQSLKLLNARHTLAFTADSRRISLNGIYVWLSAPITVRGNSAYIAAIDLSTAIDPLLWPSVNPPGQTIRSICLDPGHGGRDPGNREGRQQEKKYTLLLAKELAEKLMEAGFKVCLTRNTDTFVDLPQRPELAKRRGADLFVSLHFNSADGAGASGVSGVEVYCMTPARTSSTNARGEGASTGSYPGNRFDPKNVQLAYQIQKTMVRKLGVEDRGVRRARFAVLRSATMPAVLIEAGFMSHAREARQIYDAASRRRMAQAIAEGLLAYKQLVERPS